MRGQVASLDALAEKTAGSGRALKKAIAGCARVDHAASSTGSMRRRRRRTALPASARENYSWSLRNVHLVPMTWEEEVDLLKRELARAHASLKLEEARNRGLPELPAIQSPRNSSAAPTTRSPASSPSSSKRNLYPMRANMDPALRAQLGALRAARDA